MPPPAAAANTRRLRAVLLSALGFPGLGQLALRRLLLGVLFGLGSVLLVVVLLQRVYVETRARVPPDPAEVAARLLEDPSWPLQLARSIQRDNAAFFGWVGAGVVLLWLLSIWDAWWATRDRTAEPVEPPSRPRLE